MGYFVTLAGNEAILVEIVGAKIIVVHLIEKEILVFREIVGEIRVHLTSNGQQWTRQNRGRIQGRFDQNNNS